MKYIDADKLIAEIERRLQENADKALVFGPAFAGRTAEDNDLKNLIASLQQEQPEVGLEKEIMRCVVDEDMNYDALCHHFYELGLNTRKEE